MRQSFTLIVLIALVVTLGGMLFLYQVVEQNKHAALIERNLPAQPSTPVTPPTPVPPTSPAPAAPVTMANVSAPMPITRPTAPLNPANPAPPIRPQGAPPEPAPAQPEAIRWVLKDSRDFTEDNITAEKLQPWYEANTAGLIRQFAGDPKLQQANGKGLAVLALYGTEKAPQYFRLTARTPHTLRWTVGVRLSNWTGRVIQYAPTGFQVIPQTDPNGAALDRDRTYTIACERAGRKITWTLNGGVAAEFEAPADDRSVLSIASLRDNRELQLTGTKLEFGAGEELRDPVAVAADPALPIPAIAWKTAYEDHFDTRAAIKKYLLVDGGDLDWNEKYKALFLKNDENGGGQLYAGIPQSLPGDLRVRMRILRPKGTDEINIGLLFSIKGALKAEDGYFAEIKQGDAQIKRQDRQCASKAAPTPKTDDRWVRVELQKIGGQITLFMEGQEILTWTDPHPLKDAQHDLFSLYVWDERMLVDDLVIDRNPVDPVKPLEDNPADPQNAVNGMRHANDDPNPDQF
ncbi:MAG TPA: hypothetical protein VL860_15470 [Planctomycetota bacterium]|nr:hypothetical protein [Planctomycetota bacterium]